MRIDTRNNWMTLMFKCKCAYNCLRKQSVMDDCTAALHECEQYGFAFREIGYGGNHVHFSVNVPKKYSVMVAEIMLKSHTSRRIFEKHPGFRKRYPRGSFWSGYEHHQSTGLQDLKASEEYIRNQEQHHAVRVIDDRQTHLLPREDASASNRT
jgi:REP element-mobilizing transposase RayT